ncbi:MAG TPA: DUF6134 family protein [Steroidobacteraceae bacterium]|nr:DUF6134 family protein [Steroidobacteraceae bacterium]
MDFLQTLRLTLGAAFAAVATSGGASASTADAERLTFDVYLDEQEIGYHRYELRNDGGATVMQTEADFEVRLLFFTAYEYEHRNSELWRDGCLKNIEAQTNSNGERYEVKGSARDGSFVIETTSGRSGFADCVRTFAYWDRRLLDAERLLNSQTGEYLEIELTPLPPDELELGDRVVAVERYRLTAEGMDIRLAYAADSGEWVALDTEVRGGRTLRYRRNPAELDAREALLVSEAPREEIR